MQVEKFWITRCHMLKSPWVIPGFGERGALFLRCSFFIIEVMPIVSVVGKNLMGFPF